MCERFRKIHSKTPLLESDFNKVVFFIKKETSTQVFSCESWKNFQNPFFAEHFGLLLLSTLRNFSRKTELPRKFTEAVARSCSVKNVFLKSFAKFTGKHLCHSLLFNKVAGPRPANLLNKRLQHRYFPLNFGKFLRLLLTLQFLYRCYLFYFKVKTRSVHTYQNEKDDYYFFEEEHSKLT